MRKAPLTFTLLMMGVGLLTMSATQENSKATQLAGAYANHQNDSQAGVGSGGSNLPIEICTEAPSSVEQDACAQSSYDLSNKKLNDAYQLMQKMIRVKLAKDALLLKSAPNNPIIKQVVLADHEIQNRISASEHLWLQFREANCNLVAATDVFGSGEGTEGLYCLNSMTSLRAQELQKIMDSIFSREN